MVKCLECDRDFENEKQLHLHLRAHKLLIGQYYTKYFPRFDKYDGKPIYFKDKDQYMSADFNDRHTQVAWLKSSPKEQVSAYVVNFFQLRKQRKRLVKSPAQVELRSLNMPGKKTLNELFGSYQKFFDILGLENQFTQENFTVCRDISKQKILVDTREQKPLEFDTYTRAEALKFGDYRLSNNSISAGCYIERKSIMDFHGTMVKDFERFLREIGRAVKAGAYLVVLVEGTLNDVYSFSNRPFFNKPILEYKQRESAITSAQSVFGKMREIIYLFDNVQFLFVGNRENASKAVQKLFASDGEFKNIDLQYAFDTGKLI